MRLPRTITLPARKALMALPYCPEPPGPALMSSMRLSRTSVPSSPTAVRRISMPLSLVSVMVLRETIRPFASKIEVGRPANADQLRAVRKAQHAGAIDARRQRQRRLRAHGFVDRALQFRGLIVGAAGTHAILRNVAPERGGEGRRARSVGR